MSSIDRLTFARLLVQTHRKIGRQLGRDLYSAPALDMLLDLYVREHRQKMSLSSLGGASSAPLRTSIRAIERLVERQLLIRTRDDHDGRRINVELSHDAIALLDRLFDDLADLFAPP